MTTTTPITLRDEERRVYEEMWSIPTYSNLSPGERNADLFWEMTDAHFAGRVSVLDAGCGSGKGALALERLGYHVALCDITGNGIIPEAGHLPFYETCLWDDHRVKLGYFDWVFCCDVMEHIPPMFTMLTVSRLLEVAKRGLFLSIALHQDGFGEWVGQPLHLTVQGFVAWRVALSEIAQVVECRDFEHTGIYLVRAR
jgi:SAM-dependent methyltransferase